MRRTGKRAPRRVWLIQVRLLADKGCTVADLRRRLKGTGVEVDRTYQPKRVAPAVFVGRGFATERAVRIAGQGAWSCEPYGGRRLLRPALRDVQFFEEVRFGDPPPPTGHFGREARQEVAQARRQHAQAMQAAAGQIYAPGVEVF